LLAYNPENPPYVFLGRVLKTEWHHALHEGFSVILEEMPCHPLETTSRHDV
jgi:hypothetical protein